VATALITGISGQDGSLLAENLSVTYERVFGVTRKQSGEKARKLLPSDRIEIFASDDLAREVELAIAEHRPDEIYHFAADSFIPSGWDTPTQNIDSNYGLTLSILDSVHRHSPESRILNACSREIFGQTQATSVSESTPLAPCTPYGVNKAASLWMARAYRERHGVFVANAILFNHESPRRPEHFVTRKISKRVAEIKLGIAEGLELGNLEVRRDWGHAADFIAAMQQMLKVDTPDDFVIGTGTTHTLQSFVEHAFSYAGLDWRLHVKSCEHLVRKSDTVGCAADISKAKAKLEWSPKITFQELVEEMVESDLENLTKSGIRSAA